MKVKIISAISVTALALAACSSRSALPYGSSDDRSYASAAPALGIVGSSSGLVSHARPYIAPMQGNASNFDGWKANLRARAQASGIQAATLAAVDPYLIYQPRVVSADRSQAEFVKPIWEYLDSAVGGRVSAGRAKAAEWGTQLSAIENRYGVDRDILLGIWGMETNFGGYMGSTNVFTAMATLAYDGRRRDWAEKQLINAMKIVESGDRSADRMVGSWGGGMGHTQFIPEMYNIYAVDYTGDGQRDIWYPTDALASTANFLRNEGWIPGLPWGVEVRLPAGFDYSQADSGNFQSANHWASMGVQSLSPRGLPQSELAIYLPAGHRGPALAITRNFATIKRYNPSDSYALAVALVGDASLGLPTIQTAWPRDEQPLRKSEVVAVQRRLMAMGYDTGGADGVAGRGTRAAVRAYQSSAGIVPDGYLNKTLYNRIVNQRVY